MWWIPSSRIAPPSFEGSIIFPMWLPMQPSHPLPFAGGSRRPHRPPVRLGTAGIPRPPGLRGPARGGRRLVRGGHPAGRAARPPRGRRCPSGPCGPSERVVSRDGTVKWGLRAADGVMVEAVLIAHAEGRRTVCVSSQAGCALGCDFCATGRMGAGPQPHRGRDRRPGGARRARVGRAGRAPDERGLHGHGRAHAEPRRGAGGLRRHQLPRRAGDLGAPDRDLDRRLGAGDRGAGRAPAAGAPGRLAARGRRRHALRA